MAKTTWPKTVPVVARVGKGEYYSGANGTVPCCAVGWACAVLEPNKPGYIDLDTPRLTNFERAYKDVAGVHLGWPAPASMGVVTINDGDRTKRTLLFNAAMARLGYYKGQSQAVKDLADRTEKVLGKFKFNK